jgi:hypothetical protein
MEPEGSLLCPQELSAGPYPEPDHSSPRRPILSQYYPPTYVFVFLVFFLLAFKPIIYKR